MADHPLTYSSHHDVRNQGEQQPSVSQVHCGREAVLTGILPADMLAPDTGPQRIWCPPCPGCLQRDSGLYTTLCRRLNSFLDNVDVGDVIMRGDLEAYSCEQPHAGRH